MSKYSKHLKDQAYRKQTKQVNRQFAANRRQMSDIQDERSTYETFCEWCKECGEELYPDFYGVLSIAGSDGTDMSETHFNAVPYSKVEAIDQMLETEGYYEEQWVNGHTYLYHKPKMTYLEWFNKKFNTSY